MTNNVNISALAFALLIDTDPALTEQTVNDAYRAAKKAARERSELDDAHEMVVLAASQHIVPSREDIDWSDTEEPPLATALAAQVDGREIVRPDRPVRDAELQIAVDRFVSFAGRLPHLGSWDDRQAVWNGLSGPRSAPTPITDCTVAHADRVSA